MAASLLNKGQEREVTAVPRPGGPVADPGHDQNASRAGGSGPGVPTVVTKNVVPAVPAPETPFRPRVGPASPADALKELSGAVVREVQGLSLAGGAPPGMANRSGPGLPGSSNRS